jgi:hypothetical protein
VNEAGDETGCAHENISQRVGGLQFGLVRLHLKSER